MAIYDLGHDSGADPGGDSGSVNKRRGPIVAMKSPSNTPSLPLGVPKHVWIFAAVALIFAINTGLMMSGGPMFPGMGMRSQVELTNVVIENPDKLTRTTTQMVRPWR